jgi:hypothetical protein
MTTDNSRTQIYEPRPDDVEKSLDELESIQMEDDVKNILVTIINLMINSGDAKAISRHLWKAVELQEHHYNKIKRDSTNCKIVKWNCRNLRSKLPEFQ